MNDFDYDVMQKKRIAHSAFHKKRGSKSTKCCLPSDHLSPAEWKRRNGPVSTYKLDAPMKWDEFRTMPEDLQRKYMTNLFALYGATAEMIADMFGVSAVTVSKFRRLNGIGPGKGSTGKLSAKAKAERAAKWAAFCNGVVGGGAATETPVDEAPIEEPVETAPAEETVETTRVTHPEPFFSPGSVIHPERDDTLFNFLSGYRAKEPAEPEPLGLSHLSATFKGEFDAQKFMSWITKLPMPEGDVCINVEVTAR
jgi:hypothetical protein